MMSLVPSPLKSPVETGLQSVLPPRLIVCTMLPLFISHSSACPVDELRQMMSPVPSWLKSPVATGLQSVLPPMFDDA